MISDFGYILLFVLGGILAFLLVLFTSRLLRPHRPNVEKMSTYESGEEPSGNANVQFNPRFYVIALIFVLFEAELLFLFPWATVFDNPALNLATDGAWRWFALIEMAIFVGMLALGLGYAWVFGYLDWVKQSPPDQTIESKVPPHFYEKINQKYQQK
jgi:NADH-quinone oxidoreductase subunit A